MIDMTKIVELFGLRNATLKGNEITCSCPFSENHPNGDRHPSFGINLDNGLYHCFSCGEGGTLVQLAQRLLSLSPFDAQEKIYGDLKFDEIERIIAGSPRVVEEPITPLECDVVSWSKTYTPYWGERGFTQETIGRWQLGFNDNIKRAVVPIYFNRVLVGWTARRVDEAAQPKWQHSEHLPRRSILFGVDKFSDKSCILVEAPLSAIMLDQQGIHNGIASFGCSLSQGQADLIRGRYENVLIDYDPDKAGHDGTKRAIGMLAPYVNVFTVGHTRDDPAAQSQEENMAAISTVYPAWEFK